MNVAWIGLTAIAIVAFLRGIRFRRGDDRSYLGLYRNTNLPATYRHLPLVLPFAGAYLLCLLLAAGARSLARPETVDPRLDLLLAALVAASFLLTFATIIVRACLPPGWLTPRWLAEDDRSVGYERPKLGWADFAWLLIAAIGLLAALLVVAYVAYVLIARPTWGEG